jgi:hypothetical protein
MNIRSCELKTHLYAIAPDHCSKEKAEPGRIQEKYIHMKI